MRLDRSRRIQIGRLGRYPFDAGTYVYIGSAWGPGGLPARLRRHLRTDKKRRWHIDYLRRHATITEIWASPCRPKEEHLWAETLLKDADAGIPVKRFGSSDCRCPAHLFQLSGAPSIRQFNRTLNQNRNESHQAQIWHHTAGFAVKGKARTLETASQ